MNAKREDRYGTRVHVKKRKEEARQDLRLRGAEEPGKAGGEKLVPDVFFSSFHFVCFLPCLLYVLI